MRRKVLAALTVAFFIGFPVSGLVLIWMDAHNKMLTSAVKVAQPLVEETLRDTTTATAKESGTLKFRTSNDLATYSSVRPALGEFVSCRLSPEKNWADDSGGTIFQYVSFKADAQFKQGSRRLAVVLARRTMNPEWRIDSLTLSPR